MLQLLFYSERAQHFHPDSDLSFFMIQIRELDPEPTLGQLSEAENQLSRGLFFQ